MRETAERKFCRRFDRGVSQKRVGRGLRFANHSALKLNEHGPELNVFWTRQSGLGAAKDRKRQKPGKLLEKEKNPRGAR
jgi:hypothetical protein